MNSAKPRLMLLCLSGLCVLFLLGCLATKAAKKDPVDTPASSVQASATNAAGELPSITGTWKSAMFGIMKLKQSGAKVTGAYEYNDGELRGAIEGNRFSYRWWEHAPGQPYEQAFESHRGDGYFDISPDGKKLDGKWRYENTEEWGGNWSFRKLK